MARTVEPKRLADLNRLLGSLRKMQGQLLTLVQAKIDAMKRADIPTMRELSERERALARRLQEREGLRFQLMDAIGKELGLPAQKVRALPVSQLASRLPQQQQASLLDAAEKLRNVMSRVAQANRVAGAISREIVGHLKWVFASVKPQDEKPTGYSGDGALVAATDNRIFNAIG